MEELADATGGRYFHNNNDLKAGFAQVAAAPEFVYVLGFSPQNLKLDGAYHALKVTLKMSHGLDLQARRGYYAPKHLPDPGRRRQAGNPGGAVFAGRNTGHSGRIAYAILQVERCRGQDRRAGARECEESSFSQGRWPQQRQSDDHFPACSIAMATTSPACKRWSRCVYWMRPWRSC